MSRRGLDSVTAINSPWITRTILMKLLYYDDVTPSDYEPPFFRCCSEQEANNPWAKSPLKMEVGSVNSKHFVLALKVKSILDPCEDENEDLIEEDDVTLGGDSLQGDDSSSSDGVVHYYEGEKYIVARAASVCVCVCLHALLRLVSSNSKTLAGDHHSEEENDSIDEDNTQDPEQDEEKLGRIRKWLSCRHTETVDLADILANFPDISVALTEGNKRRTLIAIAQKNLSPACGVVKEEIDIEEIPNVETTPKITDGDYLYMKALYHALPMDYVTVSKLQSKLKGEANNSTVRKLIHKMMGDGYVKSGKGNRRLERNFKDTSTCGGIQSIGSDLTHTQRRSNTLQNGSIRSEQAICEKMKDLGNTPTSRAEVKIKVLGSPCWVVAGPSPAHLVTNKISVLDSLSLAKNPISPVASGESGIPGNGKVGNDSQDVDATMCSLSSRDKRMRKASMVKEPILQSVKRQKSELESKL
ncbi:HORMA domain [Asimina triloba]